MTSLPDVAETASPRVSVVMRSKNSDWVIGEALAALYSQSFKDFELIVVDSGSIDRTLELIAQYPHRLLEIAPEDYHPGRVLNMAIEHAQGEIIVFQNSDGVPLSPDTLSQLVTVFDDSDIHAALTRQLPRPEADSWVRREYAECFPEGEKTPEWITLSLPMAAIRRATWERHRFYSVCWGSEDTEWGHWAKSEGLGIRYLKDALIMHSHNFTYRQLYGRMFIEGEADAFIFNRAENLLHAVGRAVVSALRDVAACLRDGDFADIWRVVPRRAVYHHGYYRGNRLGTQRRLAGDDDPSKGQKVILARHTSETKP